MTRIPDKDASTLRRLSADNQSRPVSRPDAPTQPASKLSEFQERCATTQRVGGLTRQNSCEPAAPHTPYNFRFDFQIAGPESPPVLSVELKDGTVIVRESDGPGRPVAVRRVDPSSGLWQHLCATADRVKAWSWKAEYGRASKATASLLWRFELACPGREVAAKGFDCFPLGAITTRPIPTYRFMQLLGAVRMLVGSGVQRC